MIVDLEPEEGRHLINCSPTWTWENEWLLRAAKSASTTFFTEGFQRAQSEIAALGQAISRQSMESQLPRLLYLRRLSGSGTVGTDLWMSTDKDTSSGGSFWRFANGRWVTPDASVVPVALVPQGESAFPGSPLAMVIAPGDPAQIRGVVGRYGEQALRELQERVRASMEAKDKAERDARRQQALEEIKRLREDLDRQRELWNRKDSASDPEIERRASAARENARAVAIVEGRNKDSAGLRAYQDTRQALLEERKQMTALKSVILSRAKEFAGEYRNRKDANEAMSTALLLKLFSGFSAGEGVGSIFRPENSHDLWDAALDVAYAEREVAEAESLTKNQSVPR